MEKKLLAIHIFERYLWQMIIIIAVLLSLFVAIKIFVADVGIVDGVSMDPTYKSGDRFIVNKLQYLTHKPERYDVVQVVDYSQESYLIKRILGLPGETLTIEEGKIFVSSGKSDSKKQLDEHLYIRDSIYTRVKGHSGPTSFNLGANQYFVAGDNRAHSIDSRVYGPIHRARIIGKATKKL